MKKNILILLIFATSQLLNSCSIIYPERYKYEKYQREFEKKYENYQLESKRILDSLKNQDSDFIYYEIGNTEFQALGGNISLFTFIKGEKYTTINKLDFDKRYTDIQYIRNKDFDKIVLKFEYAKKDTLTGFGGPTTDIYNFVIIRKNQKYYEIFKNESDFDDESIDNILNEIKAILFVPELRKYWGIIHEN